LGWSLVLPGAALAADPPPNLQLEVGMVGGLIIGPDMPDPKISGGGGLDVRGAWSTRGKFRMGFHLGLIVTSLPHGPDAEPTERGNDSCGASECRKSGAPPSWTTSALPTGGLLLRWDVRRDLAVDLTLGMAFFRSRFYRSMGALLPAPRVGLGTVIPVWTGRRGRVVVRVGIDWQGFDDTAGFFMPMAGLSGRF
ncbi:MAG TPA: hypothetical protein PK313_10085, partial [Myxococcota bacterium]|nr:hypothetical protein [Myxococcota bacterium]